AVPVPPPLTITVFLIPMDWILGGKTFPGVGKNATGSAGVISRIGPSILLEQALVGPEKLPLIQVSSVTLAEPTSVTARPALLARNKSSMRVSLVLTVNTIMELWDAFAAANQLLAKLKPKVDGGLCGVTARVVGSSAVVPATEP